MSVTRYVTRIKGETKEVSVEPQGEHWEVIIDGERHQVEKSVVERDEILSLIIGGQSFLVDLVKKDWREGRFTINAIAEQIEVQVRDELEAIADEISRESVNEGVFDLKSPMPGIVVRSLVTVGEDVKRGQGLVILEAMKMQNELASELDGVVEEIMVVEGEMVETDAPLARVVVKEV